MARFDRDAYNEKRRERYRKDVEFRVGEKVRNRRQYRKRSLKHFRGEKYITLPVVSGVVGLSEDQIKKLETEGIIPKAIRREEDGARLYTLSQVIWLYLALKDAKVSEGVRTDKAYHLGRLRAFLKATWGRDVVEATQSPEVLNTNNVSDKNAAINLKLNILCHIQKQNLTSYLENEKKILDRGAWNSSASRLCSRGIQSAAFLHLAAFEWDIHRYRSEAFERKIRELYCSEAVRKDLADYLSQTNEV